MTLCDRCRGACCEEVELPTTGKFAADFFTREWVEARGGCVIQTPVLSTIRLPQRCELLNPDGTCSVHATPDQPTACRLAQPGEPWCRDVIRRLRPLLNQELEQEDNAKWEWYYRDKEGDRWQTAENCV